jgi:hypothetical protein
MALKRKPGSGRGRTENNSKKCGILLPNDVYSVYEEVAGAERITVSQVIARVAIEFADLEYEASCSRRAIIGEFKDELLGKSSLRLVAKRR